MKSFVSISPEEIQENLFSEISQVWALLTAQKPDGSVNTMTISWGEFGHFWRRNVVTVGVRPQRYTKEFMDAADTFSLSFLPSEYKKVLGYLGSASGRDEDKIAKSGLTLGHQDGIPFFEESNLVVLCEKVYTQKLQAENFSMREMAQEFYPENDFHTLYTGNIEKVLIEK